MSPGALRTNRRGSRVAIALGSLALVVSAVAGAVMVRQNAVRAELRQAREALAAGRFGLASQRLSRLADRWTNDGEVLFLLGNSQFSLGKRDEAVTAWSRVPASSPYFGKALLSMAARLIDAGRFSPAEALLVPALAEPAREGRYELELELIRLYRYEGRFHDVRPLVRASWCRAPKPAAVLKQLWGADMAPRPLEQLKNTLSKADQEDDRVWLGWANLAIITGQFAEASTWLGRCQGRRPDDPAVWQARLELAVVTGDVDGFWTAAQRLPANHFEPSEVLAYRSWLAATHHDAEGEDRELTKLIECAPGNAKALERLAVLKAESGRPRDAEALHRRRVEVNQARETCRNIFYDGDDLLSRAGVLAASMARLGRGFDAQAWSILAEARQSDRGPVSPGLASEALSPLPPALVARAVALSAPYGLVGDSGARGGPMLADRLTDLKRPTVARREKASPAAVLNEDDPSNPATTHFVDDAEAAGLRFRLESGHTELHLLPETMSGGVGLIDFDGDGWLDVYCVQGGALSDSPAAPATAPIAPGDRLFRNSGDGIFEDVSVKSGIARIAWGQGYGSGVTVGDYDNDGRPDLFVSRLMTYSLYRNQGDGTFADVTAKAGLAGRRDHPTSAAFADLDHDGDLDLYVCHYMIWDPAHPVVCHDARGRRVYCHPSKVPPAPDHVFRNDGDRFVDVTAGSGCADLEGRGMGVVAADLDGDSRIDLYVANDKTRNYFYRNLGGFQFEEIAIQAGVAAGVQGGYQAGMGVACGDLDGDGRPELMVTNFYDEGTTLYDNLGGGLFTDRSAASGIRAATRSVLGFGIAMADVTNHGRLDVMITNGHVSDNRPAYPYAMPSQLFENRTDGQLVDISGEAGAPWKVERVGRGLAAGDLDNDGRVDALIAAQNEPLAYFHNRSKNVGHFVTFRLEGTKSNRDGVGARVTVVAGGRRQVVQRCGGGSYQSANDPRLHFGLGTSVRVDSVEVRWPSGQVDHWTDLAVDRGYLLREGAPRVFALSGFKSG